MLKKKKERPKFGRKKKFNFHRMPIQPKKGALSDDIIGSVHLIFIIGVFTLFGYLLNPPLSLSVCLTLGGKKFVKFI